MNRVNSTIRIAPHVGKNYKSGGGIFRQRTLILGGSHYDGDYKPDQGEDSLAAWANYTEEIIGHYFDENGSGKWKKTYSNFINSIYGDATSREQKLEFFDAIIFYNYLQEIAGATANDAGNFDYEASSHFEAFKEVLEAHRPEVVICWGNKVWKALPNNWGNGAAEVRDGVTVDGRTSQKIYNYPFHDTIIRLVGVRHPCSGFGRDFHHQLFRQLDLLA